MKMKDNINKTDERINYKSFSNIKRVKSIRIR